MMFEMSPRKITVRILRAVVVGLIFLGIYILSSQFLAPVSEFFPGFEGMVGGFIIVYGALIIISTLLMDTVFQHVFSIAKELLVVAVLVSSFQSSVFSVNFENANIIVDLRLFLGIATMFGLLALAKSVLEALNYANEKAEIAHSMTA